MLFVRSALVCSLLLSLGSTYSAPLAASNEMEWSAVNLPAQGNAGGWVLAEDSDILHLVADDDDNLYCFAVVDGADILFKSEDGGRSWDETGYDGGTATSLVWYDDTLYLTDATHVYRSTDDAESFSTVSNTTLPALNAGESIKSFTAASAEGRTYLFFGTVDTGAGDFGRVCYLAASELGADWTDLGLFGYDVYSLACSPTFTLDSRIFVAATDEVGSFVLENTGCPDTGRRLRSYWTPPTAALTSTPPAASVFHRTTTTNFSWAWRDGRLPAASTA